VQEHLLFAYGTLKPETPEVATAEGWVADAVRGRLYDLGPYPALVNLDDATADWIEGYVRPVTWEEITDSLDPYEGVREGPYQRAETTTREGRRVWTYVYARPLPQSAIGPLLRWNSKKRVRLLAPPTTEQGGL
jgi:gamma-glutamylcyclotransferase (GGCT)/AIG2-like uncharacterized protein YtfP